MSIKKISRNILKNNNRRIKNYILISMNCNFLIMSGNTKSINILFIDSNNFFYNNFIYLRKINT